jgi:hypothetical protein
MGHAHGVQIAQKARLEVRVDVHEGETLAQIFFFDLMGPVGQMLARFRMATVAGNQR